MRISDQIVTPVERAPAGPIAGPAMTQLQGTALMLLGALGWGAGNVSQKLILAHLDPFSATGLTCLVGMVLLLPLARREARRNLPPLSGAMPELLQVGVVFTLAATLMQLAYGHTTVTNAGFLVNTAAVLTPILAWIAYRQRPVFWIWPASFCSLAGVVMMGGGRMSTLASGDALAVAAALCFSVLTLLVSRFVMRYRRPALMTVAQMFVCGVTGMIVGAMTYGFPTSGAIWAAMPEILIIGLISKGAAYFLIALAQAYVPPTTAAVLVSAEAIFGALAAGLFLGESPGRVQVMGGVFIILGVTIAAMIPGEKQTNASKPTSHSKRR